MGHVFFESGPSINFMYSIDEGGKHPGSQLSDGIGVSEEPQPRFKFTRQKSRLARVALRRPCSHLSVSVELLLATKTGYKKDGAVSPRWIPSSEKHGIAITDQIYAISHATYIQELAGEAKEGVIKLYIGPEHAQTDREVEILVNEFPDTGDEAVIFHAMHLTSKFDRFREENPDGWQ